MSLMEKLGVAADVQNRMQFFPNGYAAMKWLAANNGAGELGITQDTEILPNKGVTYAGPLPPEFQIRRSWRLASGMRRSRQFINLPSFVSFVSFVVNGFYVLE